MLQSLLSEKIAGEEHVERFFAKAEVAQMVLLWLADMLSDVYVTYKYCKQKMYVFALLMILIWLGSGCVAFGHRYLSWELCALRTNIKYWSSGLNEHGEPKPAFKSFALYVAQVQPVIMAWDGWLHGMTRHLREEKMLAALAEGAPSSLLQLYAMMSGTAPGKFVRPAHFVRINRYVHPDRCGGNQQMLMNSAFLKVANWRKTFCHQVPCYASDV